MRTASARVKPDDVLPRPANEVESLGEFNRISDVLYPDVRAPNERDRLTSQQFPSRANPENMLTRRGHPDLAAFVREQGGVDEHRSEENTSELQSLMRTSYAVFRLQYKK